MKLMKAADAGTDFHARAAKGAVPVTLPQLRRLIKSKERLQLLEWPLQADFGTLPIAGIPDAVCFESGTVRCILDYKLTDSNQLQMSHRVQLQLYGWLLQKARFSHDETLCVCVLVPPESTPLLDELDPATRQSLASTLHRYARNFVEEHPGKINWYIDQIPLGDGLWVRLRIFRYCTAIAKRELKFFTPYWAGERKALPSTKWRKCRVCLYNANGSCKVAVVPYEGHAQSEL